MSPNLHKSCWTSPLWRYTLALAELSWIGCSWVLPPTSIELAKYDSSWLELASCLLPNTHMHPMTPPTMPLTSSVLLSGTPMHTHSATTDWFLKIEATFQQLSIEMLPFFVGPVPPQDFLDFFLPSTTSSPFKVVTNFCLGIFSALVQSTSKAEMYGNFVSSDPICICSTVIQFFLGWKYQPTSTKPHSSQHISHERQDTTQQVHLFLSTQLPHV